MQETIQLWRWYEREVNPGLARTAVMAIARHHAAFSLLFWKLDPDGTPKTVVPNVHTTDGFAEGDSYKYLMGLKPLDSSLPNRLLVTATFDLGIGLINILKLAELGL